MRVPLCSTLLVLLASNRRAEASSRSVESGYDTNKGVFSPTGRLVQLDYVEGIVKRSNLCMGVACKDGVVLMTNKLVSADAAKQLVDGGVRRIYRVDSHIGILPAGLPADGRALAHKAMEFCRNHRREYGEPIPGRVLAERLGDFLHAACVRWGSRAYPNAILVACWGKSAGGSEAVVDHATTADDSAAPNSKPGIEQPPGESMGAARVARMLANANPGEASGERLRGHDVDARFPGENTAKEAGIGDEVAQEEEETEAGEEIDMDAGFQLYLVDPNGTSRRYKAACTGRGSGRARKWLHRRSSGSSSRAASGKPPAAQPPPSSESPAPDEKAVSASGLSTKDRERASSAAVGRSGSNRRGHPRKGTSKKQDRRQQQQNRRRQKGKLLLSEMPCAEVARALVEQARRLRASGDGGNSRGKGAALSAGDVSSVAEVAWVSTAKEAGRDGTAGAPVFVHHRSVSNSFKEEGGIK